jgi:hypothetical protein
MDHQFEDGCLCGAVRFVANGRPKWVAWCLCQSGGRLSGARVSVFAAFARAAYVVTKDEITKFSPSPGVQRGFCARCGSTLTCESERLPTETYFQVRTFDQAAQPRPMRDILAEERLPWLHMGESEGSGPRASQAPA